MKFIKTFILFFIVLFLAGFILHYFIFSIYEVKIVVKPKEVFADPSSVIKVTANPINAMGWEVPFRTVKAKFKILEGNNLVTIKLVDEENGIILLQSIGTEGKVGIYVDSEYSLFPSYIEVQILPKSV
ncbi:MAG: hypothetical protein IH795_01025 [Bacteroidetes bacterium]|nr:hypothetical protein [Bacteroidota bacterium]